MPLLLPLTPLERYYWSDDRPDYPTAFPVELQFSGQLEREPFLTALSQAVARHPLLAARIDDTGDRPRWIAVDRPPHVDWADGSATIALHGVQPIDLRLQAGLRVWVRASADDARVLFEFHHACCDGLAAFQLIEDLLVLYAGAVDADGQAARLCEPANERLRDRACFDTGGRKSSPWLAIRDVWFTIWVWSRILFRPCAVLRAATERTSTEIQADGASTAHLSFESHYMESDETGRLRRAAAARGLTMNDLLLRDILLVLHDWNRSPERARGDQLRINVPVYVRGRTSAEIPASNGIGFAFVSATAADFRDSQTLLDTVRLQTEQIKREKLALYFLGGLAIASSIRGLVPWVLRRKKSFATVVLSNLSRVLSRTPLPRRDGRLVAGNVVLERVSGVPPIRPLTRAAIAVVEYAATTSVSLRCDPLYFRPADTRAILAAYIERLTATMRELAAEQ